DRQPTGVAFRSWSGSNGHTGSGDLSDTIASLAPGGTVTYTVVATVDPAATGSISNPVTVTAANDTNGANNSATDTDDLAPKNDTIGTKDDNHAGTSNVPSTGTAWPSTDPGTGVTYTITVSNSGPSTATSVPVSDTQPTGVTFR